MTFESYKIKDLQYKMLGTVFFPNITPWDAANDSGARGQEERWAPTTMAEESEPRN